MVGELAKRDMDYALLDPKRDFCVQGFHQSLYLSYPELVEIEEPMLMMVLQVLF